MWNLRSPTRDQIHVACIGRWILNPWTARKPLGWQLWSLIQLYTLIAQHRIVQLFLFCYLLSISGVPTIQTRTWGSKEWSDLPRAIQLQSRFQPKSMRWLSSQCFPMHHDVKSQWPLCYLWGIPFTWCWQSFFSLEWTNKVKIVWTPEIDSK